MGNLRVVVADDNEIIREGLVAVINSLADAEVVGSVGECNSLLAAVVDLNPDVVVTDVRMPPDYHDEGIKVALAIREQHNRIGVVVLSQYSEPELVLSLFENGSNKLGYLLKDHVDALKLGRAIRSVSANGSAVDSEIVDILVRSKSDKNSALNRLTQRETEVLSCIAEGLNNAAIAQTLVVSDKAVAKHINAIFSKLGLGAEVGSHKRVKAVLLWLADN